MEICPQDSGFGATIRGIDLGKNLALDEKEACRLALLRHKVIAFEGQSLTDEELERTSLQFGPFGDDPFIAPISGHQHIIAV